MLTEMIKQIRIALVFLILVTIGTGLIYPMVVTGVAQLLFPWRANGSLLEQNGITIGSQLLGQSFAETKYFWGRPSTTAPFPYNALSSSGSNMGPSNADFLSQVKERVVKLHQADPQNTNLIPVDLVTASGSGLDPEISPLAAYYQVPRIAQVRGMAAQDIQALIQQFAQGRSLGILGEPRVNILQLNIALDILQKSKVTQ